MTTRPRTGLLAPARRRRGISVIEFVMAAALILGVLVASGVTLANVERSLAVSRARDGATLLAANIMTQASQFRCQLEVDPTAQTTATAWKRCVESLRGEALQPAPTSSNPAGDLFFTAEFPTGCVSAADAAADPSLTPTPGCTVYKVLLSSRWLATAADPAACQSPKKQPTLMRRTLELRWRPVSATEDVVYKLVTLQAVPSSAAYDTSKPRGLLVRTAPGTAEAPAMVTLTSGTGRISRVVEPCTLDGVPTGEAWFPYLPGTASLSVTTNQTASWTSMSVSAGASAGGFSLADDCAGVWTNGSVACEARQ